MQFPDSYFEDEVRDGFYIPSLMKRAWAAQMEVLEDVANLCQKHRILWFADFGTMLGAVRHGGRIPWDDDLDICMLRDDYIRFNQIAEKELPSGYDTSPDRSEEYQWLTPLKNHTDICWEKIHLDKYHGFPFPAGIDIFALDYIAPDPQEEDFRKNLIEMVLSAYIFINEENQYSAESRRIVSRIEELLHITFKRTEPLRMQIFSLAERLFCMYSSDEATEVAFMPTWVNNRSPKYPVEDFLHPVWLPFEGVKIPVPSCYDTILRAKYGNYMSYDRSGNMHNYPFYISQKKQLIEALGEENLPLIYNFSADCKRTETAGKTAETEKPWKDSIHPSRVMHREVVFLPFKSSCWSSLMPFWEDARENPDCNVYVIPIPYFYRNWDGTLRDMRYEGGQFPDDVPITDYRSYDIREHHPDVIFIQNPYDKYNPATSVHPSFYSEYLKQYTDHLVYVPYFTLDEAWPEDSKAEYNRACYITMPGVVHADTVVVQSESMRQTYINYLTKKAGEDTRKRWEEKITCNFRIPFLKTK